MVQRHAQINANTIRDEPDEPHHDAKTAEVCLGLWRPFDISTNGPHGVHKHQQDSGSACHRVQLVVQMRQPGDVLHQRRTRSIGQQAQQEKDKVPELQLPLQTLTPHTDRIKNECRTDDADSSHQIMYIDFVKCFHIHSFFSRTTRTGQWFGHAMLK